MAVRCAQALRREPYLITLLFISLITLVVSLVLCLASTAFPPGPLFLTPFLQRGADKEARQASLVETDVIPRSHSGLITVNQSLGNHMFFWYFPTQNKNKSVPLLMWLNGGPTVSSMMGLLWENGPLEVDFAEDGQVLGVKKRKINWVSDFSVLYVDNPVGTGFSFTENEDHGYRSTKDAYTDDLYCFLQQFFEMFPDCQAREFYIGGQSYAGKYVPHLAYRVHQERQSGNTNVPLTGIYLGGPLFSAQTQIRYLYEYLYSIGVVSYIQMVELTSGADLLCTNWDKGLLRHWPLSRLTSVWIPGYISSINVHNYVTAVPVNQEAVVQVMNSVEMKSLLHVAPTTSFLIVNQKVHINFTEDFFVPSTAELSVIMDNYKTLIFSGDFDVIISARMVEEGLMVLPWSLQSEYNASGRTMWKNGDSYLGTYTKVGRFCRVVVHGAGHETPTDQPERTLTMMNDFVFSGCIVS